MGNTEKKLIEGLTAECFALNRVRDCLKDIELDMKKIEPETKEAESTLALAFAIVLGAIARTEITFHEANDMLRHALRTDRKQRALAAANKAFKNSPHGKGKDERE